MSSYVRNVGFWLFAIALGLSVNLTALAAGAALSVEFQISGLDGGGMSNVVAVSPISDTILDAIDVAGIPRSDDAGVTYRTSNNGLLDFHAACVMYHPAVANKVYAAIGDNGTTDGVYRSLDNGHTWTLRSGVPKFGGNHSGAGLPIPENHPRSVGNLLAVDPVSGTLWTATFNDGVMRSTDDGSTWTVIGLAGEYLRSLALNPDNPNMLYVAVYGKGVYKTTAALTAPAAPAGDGAFAAVGSPFLQPEELIALSGGRVYAAASRDGIFYSSNSATDWVNINRGQIPTNGPLWLSIDARDLNGSTRIFVGCMNAIKPAGDPNFANVYRSDNNGQSWTSITSHAEVSYLTLGRGGEPWWASQTWSGAMLDGPSTIISHIRMDPKNPDRVFLANRLCVWRTTDAGGHWFPSAKGLGITGGRQVVADRSVAGRVLFTSGDFRMFHSSDALEHVINHQLPAGDHGGKSLALDTSVSPATVYFASGNRDTNTNGRLFSNANPDLLDSAWVDEGLPTGGLTAKGLVVKDVAGTRVILAAVEESGIWRKNGANWSNGPVDTVIMNGAVRYSQHTRFRWPDTASNQLVYVYEQDSGLWRSRNAGATWAQIWDRPSPAVNTGFFEVDPVDPGRLYVSIGKSGVFRLDNADTDSVPGGAVTSGTITPVRIGAFTDPGAVTCDAAGRLWVTVRKTPAEIWYVDTPATTPIPHNVTDTFYADAASDAVGIDLDRSGWVYVSLNYEGIIRGRITGTDSVPPAAPKNLRLKVP